MVSNVPNAPRYASFMADAEWKENVACRDMKPSLPNVLEVYRLAEEYKLQKVVPPVGRNSQAHKAKGLMCVLGEVYVGTPVDVLPSKRNPSTIFARGMPVTI